MSEEIQKDSFLYKLRHSLAHVMAQAVLQLRPRAKLGFGPPVDNGFYYDFDFGDELISEADLKEIQKAMFKILNKKQPFEAQLKTPEEAKAALERQDYKLSYVQELVETGRAQDGKLGFYTNGDFIDLCEGPHLEHTGEVPKGCFKLDKLAGSYWRGDEKNPMLTRIYALCFEDEEALQAYIVCREEAMKRDHRKLGRELDLFSLSEKIGGGLVLWHPNGACIRNEIENFWREEHYRNGYELLYTPHVGLSDLWKTSGHLDFYREGMYAPLNIDDRDFYVKPMNCPFHIEIYQQRQHSYRELPKRWAELGTVYRYEKSGVLNGLLRVRGFTQDDAHIICTPSQIEDEITAVLSFCMRMLRRFGFKDFKVYLATRPEKAVGAQEYWDQALVSLEKAVKRLELDCEVDEGGGAFYGPKIDLKIKDALGREWQCSTIQFDFNLPSAERFNLLYVGEDGKHHEPYMVHRALLGSIERFFALLVEHYGGAFPTWLAPIQVRLLPIAEHAYEYAREIEKILKSRGIRVEVDDSNDKFNKKIRNAVTTKIPNMWVIGGKEADERLITWRRYAAQDQPTLPLDEAVQKLLEMRDQRALDNSVDYVI